MTGRDPRVFVLVLTLVFLAGSGVLLAGVFYPPVAAVWRARGWTAVRCTIVESGIDEHRDSQGTPRYSARVRYRYNLGGTERVGTRISFLSASSMSHARAQAEAARLQPGSTLPCYADPAAPEEAVLDRKLGRPAGWLAAPLVWLIMTLVAVRALLLRRHTASSEESVAKRA